MNWGFLKRVMKDVQSPSAVELLDMAGMRQRNEERIKAIRESMGPKWICHPENKSQRLKQERPV